MRIRLISTLSAILLMMGAPAQAQERAVHLAAPFTDTVVVPGPGAPFEVSFDVLGSEPLEMGEPVVDAPYSADVVTEVVQQLADGNRIERRSTSRVARDSRGRVRREQQIAAIGAVVPDDDLRIVTISDPASGTHYSIDEKRKLALRSRPHHTGPQVAPAGEPAPGGLGQVFLRRPNDEAPPELRSESLGTKEMDGIRVEGTRTTFTLPAGAIGNRRAIEVVTQRWYSPELRVVVMSTRKDPRMGETTYRLTNVRRAEPPSELFRVPANYKIQDMEPFLEGPPLR